jgi:EgtB-related family protein
MDGLYMSAGKSAQPGAAAGRAVLARPVHSPLRSAGPAALAQALQASRARTVALVQAWQQALPDLAVPQKAMLNPPLWEWGHLAWFQEWWTLRNGQRHLGVRSASSGPGFAPSLLPQADAIYNSSEVPHGSRWQLPLPDLAHTLAYLDEVLARSLAALDAATAGGEASDDTLYFWRLALMHEDMHAEASVFMAQHLGLALPVKLALGPGRAELAQDPPQPPTPVDLQVPAQTWQLGRHGPGFAFDNECQAHPVALQAFAIDATPVTWGRYLPFLQASGHPLPPHVRQAQGQWLAEQFGHWQPLELQAPAVHLNAHDAQAWCAWAGRRLPTEAEWECAAHVPGFVWGQVWEWTASDFAPYPGFEPHPYSDYSAPWWHSHRVLRGASSATSAHVADVRYRNFFVPERRDVLAGFRSVQA